MQLLSSLLAILFTLVAYSADPSCRKLMKQMEMRKLKSHFDICMLAETRHCGNKLCYHQKSLKCVEEHYLRQYRTFKEMRSKKCFDLPVNFISLTEHL